MESVVTEQRAATGGPAPEDRPRAVLHDLIAEHGPELLREPKRVVGLLKDLCPGYRREVAVLAHALDDQTPSDLIAQAGQIPLPSLLALLAGRLHDHQGTDRHLARWAVETWATALGLLALPSARAGSPAKSGRIVAPAGGAYTSVAAAVIDPDGLEPVLVRAGRYQEPLILAGPLTLTADGPGVVALAAIDAPCLTITGGEVRVRGFTLRGGADEPVVLVLAGTLLLDACDVGGGAGIKVTGRGAEARIRHCRLYGAATAAIEAAHEARVSAADTVISGTMVAGVEATGGALVELERCTIEDGAGNGVFVDDGAEARLEGCTITRHAFAGIEAQGDVRLRLQDCTVQDGRGAGIRLFDRAEAMLRESRIRRNRLAGIDVEGGARLVMQGGRVQGGSHAGIRAGGLGEIQIDGVLVSEQAGAGLDVEEDGYLEARHCLITGNAGAGVRAAAGAAGLVEDCTVSGNGLGAWEIDPTCDLALSGNEEMDARG